VTATVRFDKVSKKFILRHERGRSFQEAALAFLRGRDNSREELWALKDASFGVERGQTLGIIGPNGSGKSTVLKLITRILEPTSGHIDVQGRVSALIELGAGFHPDLTGRENIYLNGSLLGFSRKEMKAKFDSIVEFSELEKFIDVSIKHYSSGMHMRLGFAVAIHVDPDILLIDEILAVGDQAFQSKCLAKIGELKSQGVTILFVSHDLETVRGLCDQAIWLEDGVIRVEGPTMEVVAAYLDSVRSGESRRLQASRQAMGGEKRWGSMHAEILDVRFYDYLGREETAFVTGETFIARIAYCAHHRIEKPMFGIAIYNDKGMHINGPNTILSDYPIPRIEGRGTVDYIIESLPLLEGVYFFTAAIYDHTGVHPFDHHQLKYVFRVRAGQVKERHGIFYIPSRWDWRPETPVD
jgi:ABC-type polysaccharide/polyol phosphate transport system ATPase subunit